MFVFPSTYLFNQGTLNCRLKAFFAFLVPMVEGRNLSSVSIGTCSNGTASTRQVKCHCGSASASKVNTSVRGRDQVIPGLTRMLMDVQSEHMIVETLFTNATVCASLWSLDTCVCCRQCRVCCDNDDPRATPSIAVVTGRRVSRSNPSKCRLLRWRGPRHRRGANVEAGCVSWTDSLQPFLPLIFTSLRLPRPYCHLGPTVT